MTRSLSSGIRMVVIGLCLVLTVSAWAFASGPGGGMGRAAGFKAAAGGLGRPAAGDLQLDEDQQQEVIRLMEEITSIRRELVDKLVAWEKLDGDQAEVMRKQLELQAALQKLRIKEGRFGLEFCLQPNGARAPVGERAPARLRHYPGWKNVRSDQQGLGFRGQPAAARGLLTEIWQSLDPEDREAMRQKIEEHCRANNLRTPIWLDLLEETEEAE